MVREVTSFEASDGSIHKTKLEALRHDALKRLGKLSIFNVASAQAIIAHAREVVEVLAPLVEEQEERPAPYTELDASPRQSESVTDA